MSQRNATGAVRSMWGRYVRAGDVQKMYCMDGKSSSASEDLEWETWVMRATSGHGWILSETFCPALLRLEALNGRGDHRGCRARQGRSRESPVAGGVLSNTERPWETITRQIGVIHVPPMQR